MKISDLKKIKNSLSSMSTDIISDSFKRKLEKNKQLVTEEITKMEIARKGFLEREEKRMRLCYKYCDKDKNGEAIIKDNHLSGLHGNERFNKAIDDLMKQYEKSVSTFKKMEKRSFFSIGLKKLKRSELPYDMLKMDMGPIKKLIIQDNICIGIWEHKHFLTKDIKTPKDPKKIYRELLGIK